MAESSAPLIEVQNPAAEWGVRLRSLVIRSGTWTWDQIETSAGAGRRAAIKVRNWFTLLRLLGLTMLVVVTVTFAVVHRQSQLENAAEAFDRHSDAGFAFLSDGNLVNAREEFSSAVKALDILAREDARALLVRQRYRELDAVSRLMNDSLPVVMNRADRFLDGHRLDEWRDRFRNDFGESFLILDTWVNESIDAEGSPVVDIDCPFFVAGRPVRFDLSDQADLAMIPFADEPVRVIFGAQPQDWLLESADSGATLQWVVKLTAVFLWTDHETLDQMGFGDQDGSLSPLLERQARWLNLQ